MNALPAGAWPELPEGAGESVEYESRDRTSRWLITNVRENEWFVQLAGSSNYKGSLRRDRNGVFDYEFEGMQIGPSGGGGGTLVGVTRAELRSMHFG